MTDITPFTEADVIYVLPELEMSLAVQEWCDDNNVIEDEYDRLRRMTTLASARQRGVDIVALPKTQDAEIEKLLARLNRKRGFKSINGGEIWELHNPDGPEAAALITSLQEQLKAAEAKALKMSPICDEIARIMEVYDEQMEKSGYVDTPGGLENMGDVWRLLKDWRGYLTKDTPTGKDGEKQ